MERNLRLKYEADCLCCIFIYNWIVIYNHPTVMYLHTFANKVFAIDTWIYIHKEMVFFNKSVNILHHN